MSSSRKDDTDAKYSYSASPPQGGSSDLEGSTSTSHGDLGDLNAEGTSEGQDAGRTEIHSQDNETITTEDLNVVAAYKAHFREDPMAFLQEVWAYGQGSGWRGYNNYIGAPILVPGQSEAVIRDIMTSDQVKMRISELASRRVENLCAAIPPPSSLNKEEREKAQRKLEVFKRRKEEEISNQLLDVAQGMCNVSVARLDSIAFLKTFAAVVLNVLARMYHQGIHINTKQILELRRVASFCAEKKYSILFLPCHKSHIDYLTVSWLLFRLGLAVPHIVAGENLDLPVVGTILRGGGGFFIRRSFQGDELYPVVIKEYIEQLLEKGKNMECFIEGTRSRTGKLLPPKLGILKYVVDSLLENRTEDVYLCPVSLHYDDVIESETFASELLGKPKKAESLLGLLSGGSSLLSLQMGKIDVRFKTPWSLRGFIDEQVKRREAPGPNGAKVELDLHNNPKHKVILLKALGYRCLADVNQVGVIMPAALVGTVLLCLRGRGVGKADLSKRVDWLKASIIRRGFQVADFGQMTTTEVVDRALSTMKGMVDIHTDVMEPTFTPSKFFELSFYRNQVMHVFVSEALLSVSLYIAIKQGGGSSEQRLDRSVLLRECGFISLLLRNEFVYGTDTLEANFAKTLELMCNDEVIEIVEGDRVGLTQKQRNLGRRDFDVYLFMIWPFVEGYWLAGCSLLLLAVPPRNRKSSSVQWFAAKDFEKLAQLLGKTLFEMGELSYLEAVSAQTIAQAMARYEEMGIVQRRKSKSAKSIPLIALHPEYTPSIEESSQQIVSSGKLFDVLERINSFRREGKDRRDSSNIVSETIIDLIMRNCPVPVEETKSEEEILSRM